MALCFVDETVKYVVDLLPDEGPQTQEFAVNAVQSRLEQVPFSRILGIEEIKQAQDKLLINVLLRQGGCKILGLEAFQEELVNQLEMRPRCFKRGLVLFGVEFGPGGV